MCKLAAVKNDPRLDSDAADANADQQCPLCDVAPLLHAQAQYEEIVRVVDLAHGWSTAADLLRLGSVR
jgi:hypothetical protein